MLGGSRQAAWGEGVVVWRGSGRAKPTQGRQAGRHWQKGGGRGTRGEAMGKLA